MKKVLLASTALVLSAGVAAADMRLTGNGRMGVLDAVDASDDIGFTSRFRAVFTGSGETDGGLSFGGTIRADNAAGGAAGTAGSVFISGDFGTLTMGDVSGAPEAAVGDVAGVGLTGLSDLNEATYLSNADRPAMRYDYSFGTFGIHLSADNPVNPGDQAIGVAVTYAGDMFSAGLGYEETAGAEHIIAGGSVSFGDAAIKAFYGTADIGGTDADQWGLSVVYGFGATKVTAFYVDKDALLGSEAFGIGASYDLGGGASVVGGYVSNETTGNDGFDFGISMSF
jgi:outer membrane protein OmpU